jgi:hypothetical protein
MSRSNGSLGWRVAIMALASAAIVAATAFPRSAAAEMATVFASNFNAVPLGPFTNANKLLAWSQVPVGDLVDFDAAGNFFSIVADADGSRYCRIWYPANQAGMGSKDYHIRLHAPVAYPITVEYDFMLEAGSDISFGPGKIPARVTIGTMDTNPVGVLAMWNWSSRQGTNAKPYGAILQNQPDGAQLAQPPAYTPTNVTFGNWDHFKMVFGPGIASWERNGQLVHSQTNTGTIKATDPAMVGFGFWNGGGAWVGPDKWGRIKNIVVTIGTP